MEPVEGAVALVVAADAVVVDVVAGAVGAEPLNSLPRIPLPLEISRTCIVFMRDFLLSVRLILIEKYHTSVFRTFRYFRTDILNYLIFGLLRPVLKGIPETLYKARKDCLMESCGVAFG